MVPRLEVRGRSRDATGYQPQPVSGSMQEHACPSHGPLSVRRLVLPLPVKRASLSPMPRKSCCLLLISIPLNDGQIVKHVTLNPLPHLLLGSVILVCLLKCSVQLLAQGDPLLLDVGFKLH